MKRGLAPALAGGIIGAVALLAACSPSTSSATPGPSAVSSTPQPTTAPVVTYSVTVTDRSGAKVYANENGSGFTGQVYHYNENVSIACVTGSMYRGPGKFPTYVHVSDVSKPKGNVISCGDTNLLP